MSIPYQKEMHNRNIEIYTEANPNPHSMKFVLNFMLITDERTFDFPDQSSAVISPLAATLFNFSYITRVFFMHNFITITKDEKTEWATIIPELKTFIKDYFRSSKPFLAADIAEEKTPESSSEIIKKIEQILEQYIKPAVEMDGGAIQLHHFDQSSGTLSVVMQGSCSGCPSSTLTLKAGIENLMKRMVPEVTEVVAMEG